MTTRPPDTAFPATIERYLTVVASRLGGPARRRAAIVAELRDGLLEAAGARQARGATPQQAAAAAIEEFGDPAAVARGFAPELAAASARRLALGLASTGPLVGLLWLAAYVTSRFGPVEAAPPWRWPAKPPGAWLGFPIVGVAVLVAGLATLLVLASTGPLSRALPVRLAAAPVAAAVVPVAAIIADLTMLGLVAIQVSTRPGSLAWAPLAAAITATLTRLMLSCRATRRCQAIRRTVV
jgi:hypothetical protein